MVLFGSIATAQAAETKPIIVGLIDTMSGAMSMYGMSAEAGSQVAVEEINAASGVLGRPLKLITGDDKYSPEVGLREAKDLLLGEKADFLTGAVSSAGALS